MTTKFAAGIGWSHIAHFEDVYFLLQMAQQKLHLEKIHVLALPSTKRNTPIAKQLGKIPKMNISWVPRSTIHQYQSLCQSFSKTVQYYTQYASICEACALSCLGPHARLILPKQIQRGVTCAIAKGEHS